MRRKLGFGGGAVTLTHFGSQSKRQLSPVERRVSICVDCEDLSKDAPGEPAPARPKIHVVRTGLMPWQWEPTGAHQVGWAAK